ncbi:MAG: SpoIIE family protein phosphatase [Candidatus Nitronauta litoralis]|uniref:SpoIIE family protein phosphatase n=1 Tax=Candidatus Nitronauta litoralis TaxID=2705533 RepID=A0A7T0BX40_9BACT|nr:MAG: SpoIIE family protein phosphatase [Candidatus Nitronauta litoralis]
MDNILTSWHDPVLVTLSYVIAVLGAFVALTLILRYRQCPEEKRCKRLLAGASVSMGGGIWSMHFIGLMAMNLPVNVTYRFVPTVLSLIIAIAVTFYGFRRIVQEGVCGSILSQSGFLMGMGIILMHYLGMFALEFPGKIIWNPALVLTSVVIAITTANAALWIFLKMEPGESVRQNCKKISAAMIMGLAVCGMHYTGMAAADLVPLDHIPFHGKFTMESNLMAYSTVGMIVFILALALITSSAVEHMGSRQRLAVLILIMSGVVISVTVFSIYFLYQTGFIQQRQRMIEIVKSQARLVEAIGRFNKRIDPAALPQGAYQATLSQIRDAQKNYPGFGETGEFALARKENGKIKFMLHQRYNQSNSMPVIEMQSAEAIPMKRALMGKSGVMTGNDYRGVKVLAAFEPVPELALGLVVKMDVEELRAPYIKAALLTSGLGAVAIALGAWLFFGISNPMITRLEKEIKDRESAQKDLAKSKEDLSKAQEVAQLGNWVWEMKTDEVRWSDQTYRIMGYKPGDFETPAGQFEKAVHPSDWEEVDHIIEECVATGKPLEMEHRIVWPDGTIRYVLGKGEAILDETGTPIKLVGTIQDITERKKIQEEVQQLTLEKEKIENELEVAKLVQEGFLPEKPPSPPGVLFAAQSVPAKFVGGDFYDFIDLGEERLGLVLGDVSGKGVSAALFMAQLLSDLRNVSQLETDPSRIMSKVNDLQCRRSRRGMFATAVYLMLDLKRNSVSASNAGHPPVFVRSGKDGSLRQEAKEGGIPLGIMPSTDYKRMDFDLEAGDQVLTFTDGANEAINPEREPFGLDRLETIFKAHTGTPEELIIKIQSAITQFRHPQDPSDDLTLMAFKIL